MLGPEAAADEIAAAITPQTRLVAFVAVAGVGKSTIVPLLVQRHAHLDLELISSDAIRAMLGDEADQSLSQLAFDIAYERLRRALAGGRTVVWDATNYQAWARGRLVAIARDAGVETLAVLLRVPLSVALRRNRRVHAACRAL